ncbi:hypothetical protein OPT61_g10742 [Boeremia exigua]|uniref:Uncharacterized protein n=1 Tax=Boeremia exigua TaxID=749465 RepID=A0ACC2HN08_9PLEO|nr:hypothetical protein OPT61_g10742 [Boeremia exigua]
MTDFMRWISSSTSWDTNADGGREAEHEREAHEVTVIMLPFKNIRRNQQAATQSASCGNASKGKVLRRLYAHKRIAQGVLPACHRRSHDPRDVALKPHSAKLRHAAVVLLDALFEGGGEVGQGLGEQAVEVGGREDALERADDDGPAAVEARLDEVGGRLVIIVVGDGGRGGGGVVGVAEGVGEDGADAGFEDEDSRI